MRWCFMPLKRPHEWPAHSEREETVRAPLGGSADGLTSGLFGFQSPESLGYKGYWARMVASELQSKSSRLSSQLKIENPKRM